MIDPETIATVKERTDIVALIGQHVRLAKKGRSFLGLCPFHKEKTPSFSVNQERGFFHCFGCKESGSAIDFLMKLEGLTFPEAVRALADRCGIQIRDDLSDAEQQHAVRRKRQREQLYAVNQLAATFFEQQLRVGAHPLAHLARAELAQRGISFHSDNPATQEALAGFRIGYAPYGWSALVDYLVAQGQSLTPAEKVGLIAERARGGGHYDRFRHRLMFAVVDIAGRVVGFSGRALTEPTAEQLAEAKVPSLGEQPGKDGPRAPAKYINSPESPVYSKGSTVFGLYQARHAVRQREEAVLVEGNFDVLALHARGSNRAVAPLGTAFTPEQARLLKRYARSVVIMFDGDEAGKKAIRAARQPCSEAQLNARVAVLPAGTDPDSFTRAEGLEAMDRVISGARGMLDYLIDEALSGEAFRDGSLREKQQRIRAVAELLATENDPTLRAMAKAYADRLSSQLVVGGHSPADMRELERLIRRSVGGGQKASPAGNVTGRTARSPPRENEVVLEIFGAILDFPELLGDSSIDEVLSLLEGDVALGVAAVREMWDPKKSTQTAEILDLMPPAIHSFAASRLAAPKFDELTGAHAELIENAKKLRRRAWSREKAQMVEEIARAEQLGDCATEDELLRELARRSKEKLGLS